MISRKFGLLPVTAFCVASAQPVLAQMIETPAGPLHIGMTVAEAEHVLGRPSVETVPFGGVKNRVVSSGLKNASYVVIFTSRGVAYELKKLEYQPDTPAGHAAGETAFQNYMTLYRAPSFKPSPLDDSYKESSWKTAEGNGIMIEFGCHRTVVEIEITNYTRKYIDDRLDESQRIRIAGGCPF